MPDGERSEDVYVVRIRRELRSPNLRGYVDDVAHGERLYFTAFRDLAAFLQARIDRNAQQ